MDQIIEKDDCCGCGACAWACPRHCIKMVADAEGFLYPDINQDDCIDCHICQKTCPGRHADEIRHGGNGQEIIAATNQDPALLNKSSSGGVFLELCTYVIAQGRMVAGAIYDDEMTIRHVLRERMEDCLAFAGSKYAQSSLGDIFSEIKETLKTGRLVLFSGTPCQIAGLRRYLKKSHPNLLTCDLVCHGVASPLAFEGYVKWLEGYQKKRIASICMKDKTHGWLNPQIRVEFSNGKELNGSDETQVWQRAYNSALYMRPSCYRCPYTSFQRTGDISLGDFWAVQNIKPDIFNPNGVSLVLLNTEMGREVFSHIKGNFKTEPLSEKEAIQSSLSVPVKMPEGRSSVMNSLSSKGFMSHARSFRSSRATRYRTRLGRFIRMVASKLNSRNQ